MQGVIFYFCDRNKEYFWVSNSHTMSLAALIVSIIICPYFIIITPKRYYLYSLTIFLYLLASVGALFKIMHLPGADEMLKIGFTCELLAGTFLIISGNKTGDNKFKAYKIILGILLIVHLLLGIVYSYLQAWDLHLLVRWLPGIIFLIAGWIIISKRTLHEGEKNLLIVILVQSIVAILSYLKVMPLS